MAKSNAMEFALNVLFVQLTIPEKDEKAKITLEWSKVRTSIQPKTAIQQIIFDETVSPKTSQDTGQHILDQISCAENFHALKMFYFFC